MFAGDKLKCLELDKFFKDFIALCNHSKGLQKDWRDITGLPWQGYGGVRWFNRQDVLIVVLESMGTKGRMQDFLVHIAESDNILGKRLKQQGDYSQSHKTETLHMQMAVSVEISKMLRHVTYFLEADQLNVIFGANPLLNKCKHDFQRVLDPAVVNDPVTTTITQLIADGHLTLSQQHDKSYWLGEANTIVKPAAEYWDKKSTGFGDYAVQFNLYKLAHAFKPSICATFSEETICAEYDKLLHHGFDEDLVEGLKTEAKRAIEACENVSPNIVDVVNFWDGLNVRPQEHFHYHALVTQRFALMMPSSACVERVFSRLKSHFSLDQMVNALEDYVEASIMLDYNQRDIVTAWY
jgi:hypothetical protein